MSTMAKVEHLAATDLCDRCSARALFAYRLPSGGELMFCSHHQSELLQEVVADWTLVGVGDFK